MLILGVAFCVSAYSVIDGAAVQRTPAAAYEAAVCALGALLVAPVVIGRHGLPTVRRVLRRNWLRVAIVGAAMGAAYVAVLVSFRLAPIAYVGALREVSIVMAAVAGWRYLGERATVPRMVGAVVIVLGMACVVLLG
jgi:drug/metabolite transporter (DMT)-like permease